MSSGAHLRPGAASVRAAAPPRQRGAALALAPASQLAEPPLAFASVQSAPPAGIEIRVNFGVYAGREASYAEIDRLSRWLLDRVEQVTIVSELRHEIGARSEAAVHQVRIAVDAVEPGARDELEQWLLARAEHWARLCLNERNGEDPERRSDEQRARGVA